jgi:hypothetical protein
MQSQKFKRLGKGWAIPGWLLIIWGVLDHIGNIQTLQSIVKWLSSLPLNTVILIAGFLWLGILVFEPWKKGAPLPVKLPPKEIGGQLVIVEGKYGSDQIPKWKDVTKVLMSMVVNNELRIEGKYNDLFAPDPIRGEPKELVIDYMWGGYKFLIRASEDAKFRLPF